MRRLRKTYAFALGAVSLTAAMLTALLAVTILPAQAATSLANEFLSSHTEATITGGTCNPAGDTTYTFTASGVSSDPYAGTFTESGSVTIGAQTDEFVPGQFRGPIRAFSATYTINSPSGTVHGTASLAYEVPPDSGNAGVCIPEAEGAQVLTSNLTYAATITEPSGASFTDVGTGASNFNGHPTPNSSSHPKATKL